MASLKKNGGGGGNKKNGFEHLMGWAGPELAKKEYAKIASTLPKFSIQNATQDWKGKKRMLYDYTRKVLGKDADGGVQLTGDCTSWSARNCINYLQCVQIASEGKSDEFKDVFPPYVYSCSRNLSGGGQLGSSQGSVGAWVQDSLKKYGTIFSDSEGCPKYSESIANQWGNRSPSKNFLDIGSKYPVKTTALITNAEDCAAALYNGFPISVCSNFGFTFKSYNGFMQPSGTWNHAMSILGYHDSEKYGLFFWICNSWGDQFEHLLDLDDPSVSLPIGGLRVKGDVVNRMLAQGDSYAYSNFLGFPSRAETLDRILFDIVGK